jgi:hypothetical protein
MKKRRMIWIALLLMAGGILAAGGCALTRHGYEAARYRVAEREGAFELRDYDALPLASTGMTHAEKRSADGAFMRLFRYISKDNERDEKIAMTVPVFIGMEGGEGGMSFVLPDALGKQGAPMPRNEEVSLGAFTAGRYAVYRYSGGWSRERALEAESNLREWLGKHGLEPAGEGAILANYDPPFTPAFLRRNEILIHVADDAALSSGVK